MATRQTQILARTLLSPAVLLLFVWSQDRVRALACICGHVRENLATWEPLFLARCSQTPLLPACRFFSSQVTEAAAL